VNYEFSERQFPRGKAQRKRDEEGLVMEDLLLAKSISSFTVEARLNMAKHPVLSTRLVSIPGLQKLW